MLPSAPRSASSATNAWVVGATYQAATDVWTAATSAIEAAPASEDSVSTERARIVTSVFESTVPPTDASARLSTAPPSIASPMPTSAAAPAAPAKPSTTLSWSASTATVESSCAPGSPASNWL